MSGFLVRSDVDRVQAWLFRSVHLREIAGASQLLVDYDAAVARVAGEGEVLSSDGGTALVRFAGSDRALQFRRELPQELRRLTVNATVTVSEPQAIAAEGFGDTVDRAVRDVELKKRLGRPEGEPADACFALRCEGCGSEPVVESGLVKIGGEPRFLGAACLRRHEARDRPGWLQWMDGQPGWQDVTSKRTKYVPADANELSGGGKLALVLADVDGVGERLTALRTEEAYCCFSKGLTAAVRSAVVKAVAGVVTPARDEPAKLPIEVLFAGGDDLLVACRGDLALEFVQRLVAAFAEQRPDESASWWSGVPLGMSAAVVVVNPKFPFRVAHAIGGRLLRRAKQAAREEGWAEGAVDWAVVTESWAEAEEILADRVIESSTSSLHLTGRPYRASAAGPQSLGSFHTACKHLTGGFPRSKLHELRQLCAASELSPGPAGNRSRSAVDQARRQLTDHLSRVIRRLQRRPEVRRSWEEACQALHLTDPACPVSQLETDWRTPVGDLAEGLGLWRWS